MNKGKGSAIMMSPTAPSDNDRRLGCLCDKMMYRLEPSPRRSCQDVNGAVVGLSCHTSSTSTLATANTQNQRRPQIARLPPITRNPASHTVL